MTIRRVRAGFFLLGLAGFLLVLFGTSSYGAGLSNDSVAYIAAARDLAQGRGLVFYDGTPMVRWPPLLPFLLAGVRVVTGMDPLLSIRYVNGLAFGLTIFLAGWFIQRRTGSSWLSLLGSALTLFSLPLFGVSVMAWSEPLFILLTLAFFITAPAALESERRRSLMVPALFSALAALTRYHGAAVIGTGVILLLAQRGMPAAKRLGRAVRFGGLAAAPLALWLFRNLLVSHTLTGIRQASRSSLLTNWFRSGDTISLWFLPGRLPAAFRAVPLVLLAAAWFYLVFIAARKSQAPEGRAALRAGRPLVVFAFLYLVGINLSATLVAFDHIGSRLLSPLYLALALPALMAGTGFANRRGNFRLPAKFFITLLALAYPLWATGDLAVAGAREGLGVFDRPRWRDSATIAEWRRQPLADRVYSNNPYSLYLWAGARAGFSPYRGAYLSPEASPTTLEKFIRAAPGSYLVWFNEATKGFDDPAELSRRLTLTRVREFSDGAIYRIGNRGIQDTSEENAKTQRK